MIVDHTVAVAVAEVILIAADLVKGASAGIQYLMILYNINA
jgi:hypothetical protein